MKQFEALSEEVNMFLKQQDGSSFKPMKVPDVAMGFIKVANEAMCRPIRALTQVRPLFVVIPNIHAQ